MEPAKKFNAKEWVPESKELLNCLRWGIANMQGIPAPISDYRLAQILQVSKASISEIRRGKTTLGAPTCKKVAEIMGVPYEWVLACVEAERAGRAQNEQLRDTWIRAAQKLVILLIVLMIGVGTGAVQTAQAGPDRFIHYARALGKALGAWLIRRGWGLAIQGGLSWRLCPPVPQAV